MRHSTILLPAATLAAALTATTAFAKDSVNVGVCVSWPGYGMLEVAKEKNLISRNNFV